MLTAVETTSSQEGAAGTHMQMLASAYEQHAEALSRYVDLVLGVADAHLAEDILGQLWLTLTETAHEGWMDARVLDPAWLRMAVRGIARRLDAIPDGTDLLLGKEPASRVDIVPLSESRAHGRSENRLRLAAA